LAGYGRAGPGSRLESALERAFSVPLRSPDSRVFHHSQSRLRLYVYKSPFAANLRAARRAKLGPEPAHLCGKRKAVCGKPDRAFPGFAARISHLRQGASRHCWSAGIARPRSCIHARLSHKAVLENCCAPAEMAARAAGCDDLGTDAARMTDAVADFGTHPQKRSSGLAGGLCDSLTRKR
jgi:hypothetical protein